MFPVLFGFYSKVQFIFLCITKALIEETSFRSTIQQQETQISQKRRHNSREELIELDLASDSEDSDSTINAKRLIRNDLNSGREIKYDKNSDADVAKYLNRCFMEKISAGSRNKDNGLESGQGMIIVKSYANYMYGSNNISYSMHKRFHREL
jgi:hypothetical protein